MNEYIQIKQRKEDCHYETIFWTNKDWQPIHCGYGFSQKEADTNCLKAFLKNKYLISQKYY